MRNYQMPGWAGERNSATRTHHHHGSAVAWQHNNTATRTTVPTDTLPVPAEDDTSVVQQAVQDAVQQRDRIWHTALSALSLVCPQVPRRIE